jgi:hypothetical protein
MKSTTHLLNEHLSRIAWLITSNVNKQFTIREFKQYATNMSIKVNIVLVETHHSIKMIEKYHDSLRRIYAIIFAQISKIDSNSTLQMTFKTFNDSVNINDLILILLVFHVYSRVIEINALSSMIICRFIEILKTMKEVRKSIAIRQLNNALNSWRASFSILIHSLLAWR